MPKDVVLGEGRIGDALLRAFPGQYGAQDSEERRDQAGIGYPPGFHSQVPTYLPGYQGVRAADPDAHPDMVLQDMPGVGLVAMPGVAAIQPVDHGMVGTEEEELSIIAMDDFAGLGAVAQFQHAMKRLAEVAGRAAARAVAMARAGRLRSVGEAEAYIMQSVQQARGIVQQKVTARMPHLGSVVKQVVRQAMQTILPKLNAIFGRQKGPSADRRLLSKKTVGDWPGSMMDWPGSMMSDLGKLKADHRQLGAVAGAAARRAVEMARAGQLGSAAAAKEYVKNAVSDALRAAESKVSATLADKVVAHALALVRGDLDGIFGSQAVDLVVIEPGYGWGPWYGHGPHGHGGPRHRPHRPHRGHRGGRGGRRGMRGIDENEWDHEGLDGLTESIASLAAGRELDDLNRSVSKLHDALIASYSRLEELEKARAQVEGMRSKIVQYEPGTQVPTAAFVQFLKADSAVKEGYNAITGFDYMTKVIGDVFRPKTAQLAKVYSGVDGLLKAIANWNDTWTRRVQPIPGQLVLWDAIQNRHNQLYSSAAPGKALDVDDPVFVTTALQAVEQVTGFKADQLRAAGMGDFGITALIGVIVVTVGLIAVSVAAVKLAKEFNVVANNLHEQRLAHESKMEAQRKEYIAKRTAEGVSVAQATEEWAGVKSKLDAAEAAKQAQYAKTPSALDIGKYLLPAAGVFAAVTVLPKLLGIG